jgi:hypothetical protein
MHILEATIFALALAYIALFVVIASLCVIMEFVNRKYARDIRRAQELFDLEKAAADVTRYNVPKGFYR